MKPNLQNVIIEGYNVNVVKTKGEKK